jgi:hypothetical protein
MRSRVLPRYGISVLALSSSLCYVYHPKKYNLRFLYVRILP